MGKKVKNTSTGKIKQGAEQSAKQKEPGSSKERKKQVSRQKDSSAWLDALGGELAAVGLRVKQVAADGNCFFRAVADQLGNAQSHLELRARTVSFMRQHQDEFEPFMEDDELFDHYCNRMAKDGTWAGQQEQVAAARCLGVTFCIYQAHQPCWTIQPDHPSFPKDAPLLHLSYHGEEHYNSVRLQEDYGIGPPMRIVLRDGPARISALEEAHKQVKQAVGCADDAAVTAALKAATGNIDEAIEHLIGDLAAQMDEVELTADETQTTEGIEGLPETTRPISAGLDEQDKIPRDNGDAKDSISSQQSALGPSAYDQQRDVAAALPDKDARGSRCATMHSDGFSESSGFCHTDAGDADQASLNSIPAGDRTDSADKQRMVTDSDKAEPPDASPRHNSQPEVQSQDRKASAQKQAKPVGRNQQCPCGSHKKFKACCGKKKPAHAGIDPRTSEAAELGTGKPLQMTRLYV